MTGSRTRALLIASLVAWFLSTLIWFALLGTERVFGCPGLTNSSGSESSASWRWLPPGEQCIYRVSGGLHVDQPPDSRVAVFGLLLVWPVLTMGFGRAASADIRELVRQGQTLATSGQSGASHGDTPGR